MGTTLHGVKYPEPSDAPNVPSDIGGTGKLDATAQAWLALLDTTNIAGLAARNIACAGTEAAVTTATNSVATATARQVAQQGQINAIASNNDSITSRLNTRDTTLAADQSTIQGYTGQITGLQSLKPRGLLGIQPVSATDIPIGSGWTVLGSVTFNDPATPSSSRQYRAMVQTTAFDTSGLTGTSYVANVAIFYTAGSAFGTSRQLAVCQAALDTFTVTSATAVVDQVFTSVTDSQWTVWAAAQQSPSVKFSVGTGGDFLTLEDVGLSP